MRYKFFTNKTMEKSRTNISLGRKIVCNIDLKSKTCLTKHFVCITSRERLLLKITLFSLLSIPLIIYFTTAKVFISHSI